MFYRILSWLQWIFGVVPKSAIGSAVVYRIAHYTLVVIVAIILAVFSTSILGANRVMGHGNEFVNNYWCGFVFLLAYAIVRVVFYLLAIIGIEEESEFLDIDRPWDTALLALNDEGISVDDLPLFLVNGLTPQQEQSVFQESANIDWLVVSPAPNDTNAPLRIFANSDAIFVSCTGIGSVSFQQGKVVDSSMVSSSRNAAPIGIGNQTHVAGQPESIMGAARAGTGTVTSVPETPPVPQTPQAPPKATGTLRSIGAALAQATMSPGGVQRAMKSFSGANSQEKGYGKQQVAPITEMEAEIGSLRMEHLCSRIRESRYPYCPINGLLQAIPVTWATSDEYAKNLTPAIRNDLETIHGSLQLQFPVVVVFSELDSLPGLKEFLVRLERIQSGIRNSRAGSRFWPGAEIESGSVDLVLERAMNWFRGWVYAAFADDISSNENRSLFHLLCSIRQKKSALAIMLRGSLYQITDPEVRLSGCYFTATGAGSTEQGFIRGVLDRLVEMEDEVAWSPDFTRSLSKQTLWTRMLFVGAAVLAVVNAFLIYNLP